MRSGHQSLTDDELEERLKEEQRLLRMGNAKERIIAKRVIGELEREKVRRYELKWGLS
jgi:hypothetical protein